MNIDRHLTTEQIELYVLGVEDEVEVVEEHVASCDDCGARLAAEARLELTLRDAAAVARWCPRCEIANGGNVCLRCGVALAPGGYVTEAVVAEHTQGRVYIANDGHGRRVRITELVFAHVRDNAVVDGFEKEVRLLAELNHPGIPRLIDSFREGDDEELRLYAVEDFIEGETLLEHLAGHRTTEAEVRDVAMQVLDVLVYLQSLSPAVFHRDVRPHNIIRQPSGEIVLRQFAHARDMGVTGAFTLVGHTGYIPAEQHVGVVDKTSDLYGLGATLAHLLTRRAPLPNDPGLERANISEEFRRWIERLMAERPKDRFPSAAAAQNELVAPVVSVTKAPSRRRLPLLIAACVGGLLVGAAIAGPLMFDPTPTPPPTRPVETAVGWIQIDSDPRGARIVLDGAPMMLRSGEQALTPSDVNSLVVDRTYTLRLEYDGYEPFETTIDLGRSTAIRAKLVPRPGRVEVEITGDDATRAALYVDGETSPARFDAPGLEALVLEARVGDRVCATEKVSVVPNETTRRTLECHRPPPRKPKPTAPPPPAPDPIPVNPTSKPVTPECRSDPFLPSGFATINTQPPSNIFWNGVRIGQTPLARHRLPAGCLIIKAVAVDGSVSRTVNITIEPNRVRIYSFKLK